MTDTSKGNESVRFKSTMSKPNTSMSVDEQWVPAEHYALNVIWKRVNRHGKYHDKPMKYTEFVEAIEQYALNKQVEARLDEATYHLQFYRRPHMYDFSKLYEEQSKRITELEKQLKTEGGQE